MPGEGVSPLNAGNTFETPLVFRMSTGSSNCLQSSDPYARLLIFLKICQDINHIITYDLQIKINQNDYIGLLDECNDCVQVPKVQ